MVHFDIYNNNMDNHEQGSTTTNNYEEDGQDSLYFGRKVRGHTSPEQHLLRRRQHEDFIIMLPLAGVNTKKVS